jgi:hypothetical protein
LGYVSSPSTTMMSTSGSERSSSAIYWRSLIRNSMTRSASGVSATASQNSGLLSPPQSARTSLDTPLTAPASAPQALLPISLSIGPSVSPLASPPETMEGSPLTEHDSNILALKKFIRAGPRQAAQDCKIRGVTPSTSKELLKDLEVYLASTGQGGVWELLR